MSINHTFGLNIRVLSIEIPKYLAKDNDEIRVSVTTIPEQNKQAFVIQANKLKDSQLIFGVNVSILQEKIPSEYTTTCTEEILIVLRKKNFFKADPIIARARIKADELPQNLSEPVQIKTFNLFQQCDKAKYDYNDIIGKIQVQLSLTDPFNLKDFDDFQMDDISKGSNDNDHKYTNDKFRIGQNYYRFSILD